MKPMENHWLIPRRERCRVFVKWDDRLRRRKRSNHVTSSHRRYLVNQETRSRTNRCCCPSSSETALTIQKCWLQLTLREISIWISVATTEKGRGNPDSVFFSLSSVIGTHQTSTGRRIAAGLMSRDLLPWADPEGQIPYQPTVATHSSNNLQLHG